MNVLKMTAPLLLMCLLAEPAFAKKDKGGNEGSGGGGQSSDTTPVPVPETGSTLLLLGAALLGVAGFRRWVLSKPTA